jgi:dienelactone hydrolase
MHNFSKHFSPLLLYLVLFTSLASCNAAGQSNKTIQAVESTGCCQSDSNNTYEVFIPERNSSLEKLPLLVILDSHGSGKFALNKFKHSAMQYSTILVASNLVKNGLEGYENTIQALVDDVRSKYPIGNDIFVTGFSGGARMALGYALTHQVNGLILCGALANADQIKATHCSVISISGMDDFNFIETAQYLFQEQSTPKNLKIELTDASHSWPDSIMLANAFGFLSLSCPSVNAETSSKSQLKTYNQDQQTRINSLKKHGDFLKAIVIAHNLSTTEPFNEDKVFASTYNELKSNSGYISQLNKLKTNLDFEMSVRQPYLDAFRTKDMLWWEKEIRKTELKIKTEKDSYTKNTYSRIKGFWGIASYSLCKQAVNEHNATKLNRILSVYHMLEPENPDMLYFSSFPSFWKQNDEATITMLKKALKSGYSDMNQLKKDFPESITSKLLIQKK